MIIFIIRFFIIFILLLLSLFIKLLIIFNGKIKGREEGVVEDEVCGREISQRF